MRLSALAATLLAFGLVAPAHARSFTIQLPTNMTVAPGGTTTETISFTYTPDGSPAQVQLKRVILPIRVQQGTGGATLPTLSLVNGSGFDFTPGAGYILDSLGAGATGVTETASFTVPNVTTYTGSVNPAFNLSAGAAPHANGNLLNFSITAGAGVAPGTYLLDFEGGGKSLELTGFDIVTSLTTFSGGTLTVTPEPSMVVQIMGIFGVVGPVVFVRRWRKKRAAAA